MNIKNRNGFSLVEMMTVAAILGIVLFAFSNFMSSIGTAYKAQIDLETRADLFQTFNFIQRMTDCSKTTAGISVDTAIPTEGLAISLKSTNGTVDLISEFGSKKGKFSYIADLLPDRSIKIRAAAFKTIGELPRNRLGASNSEFLAKKSSSDVWSWSFTDNFVQQNFSGMAAVCGGAESVAADTSGSSINVNCSSVHYGSWPNETSGIRCFMLNAANGKVCIFNAFEKVDGSFLRESTLANAYLVEFPGFSGVSDKMILYKHEENSEKIKI